METVAARCCNAGDDDLDDVTDGVLRNGRAVCGRCIDFALVCCRDDCDAELNDRADFGRCGYCGEDSMRATIIEDGDDETEGDGASSLSILTISSTFDQDI